MIIKTGRISKFVLVHNNIKVFVKQFNDNQETTCDSDIYTIETFDIEESMQDRINELDLVDCTETVAEGV